MGRERRELTNRSAHFDFGKNWAAYSELVDSERLEAAIESLRRLVPNLAGRTFLDVGSGSGLFSVGALRLGAARVHAIDIDEESVATTRQLLKTHGDHGHWIAEQMSVFNLSTDDLGTFDVVYSWGVLHHTGDMWRAIDRAARMVVPGGIFALALYEKTPLCGTWRIEKRAYMRASPAAQRLMRSVYMAIRRVARWISGTHSGAGMGERGMDFEHDVHDWLGGYPYESANRTEVAQFMRELGFEPVLHAPVKVRAFGLLGTGCSEYVYRKITGSSAD
jgi:2-polyprenyl-6-hydroxyphenyl methylase/3-demethylubiquinone-9 3-methyltransferase